MKAITLPKTPSVRGNVRLQKGTKCQEKRLLEKNRLNKQETNNESRLNTTDNSRCEIDMIGDPKEMLTDVHINAAQKLPAQLSKDAWTTRHHSWKQTAV